MPAPQLDKGCSLARYGVPSVPCTNRFRGALLSHLGIPASTGPLNPPVAALAIEPVGVGTRPELSGRPSPTWITLCLDRQAIRGWPGRISRTYYDMVYRAAQTGVFDLENWIFSRLFLDACTSFAAETGRKSRNV
jgi:hypothetical protein